MRRQLRVVEPENAQRITEDMELNVRQVIDMGKLLYMAAHAIDLENPYRTAFERLGWLIREKGEELEEQRRRAAGQKGLD